MNSFPIFFKNSLKLGRVENRQIPLKTERGKQLKEIRFDFYNSSERPLGGSDHTPIIKFKLFRL